MELQIKLNLNNSNFKTNFEIITHLCEDVILNNKGKKINPLLRFLEIRQYCAEPAIQQFCIFKRMSYDFYYCKIRREFMFRINSINVKLFHTVSHYFKLIKIQHI